MAEQKAVPPKFLSFGMNNPTASSGVSPEPAENAPQAAGN
jgi:hypothetical protein